MMPKCADGGPFEVQLKRGTARKILVFFGGGGVCFSAQSCGGLRELGGEFGYPRGAFDSLATTDCESERIAVGEDLAVRDAWLSGDWWSLFVPSCAADAFLGRHHQTYTSPVADLGNFGDSLDGRFNVSIASALLGSKYTPPAAGSGEGDLGTVSYSRAHVGRANALAAIKFVAESGLLGDGEWEVVLAGASMAGGMGVLGNADAIAALARLPAVASLHVLVDGAMPLLSEPQSATLSAAWGSCPTLGSISSAEAVLLCMAGESTLWSQLLLGWQLLEGAGIRVQFVQHVAQYDQVGLRAMLEFKFPLGLLPLADYYSAKDQLTADDAAWLDDQQLLDEQAINLAPDRSGSLFLSQWDRSRAAVEAGVRALTSTATRSSMLLLPGTNAGVLAYHARLASTNYTTMGMSVAQWLGGAAEGAGALACAPAAAEQLPVCPRWTGELAQPFVPVIRQQSFASRGSIGPAVTAVGTMVAIALLLLQPGPAG